MKKILAVGSIGALIGLALWLIAVFAWNASALVFLPVSIVFGFLGTLHVINPWLIGMAQMIYFAAIAVAVDVLIKSRLKFKRLLFLLFVLLLISVHTLVYYQTRLNKIHEVAAKAIVDALEMIVKERDPAIFGNTKADQNNQ